MISQPDNYKFIINGVKPLHGSVKVSGAKNSATKLMVASMLSDEKSFFKNSPNGISELGVTIDLCKILGSEINQSGDNLEIQTPNINTCEIPSDYGNVNRVSILTAGVLLHRSGEAKIPIPGGCKIGSRPVNFHIEGLKKLGCTVEMTDYFYNLKADKLHGNNIHLEYPSVGATENILMAAALAEGRTIIFNAAVEPEIYDLIKYLQKMGAIIEISTDRKITIEGVDKLYGAYHSVIPDRNQAASFAVAGLVTKGDVFVENAVQDDLITFLNTIRRIGGEFEIKDNGIRFFYNGPFNPIAIETNVHPGFMTDWQQPLVILLTQAKGISIVHETVYEKRFGYVEELNKMGAEIELYNTCLGGLACRFANQEYFHSAVIKGPVSLHGAEIVVPDLRGGMSYLIAGLIAKGETVISGIRFIDRGYENIDGKLRDLGADIKRV
ncbi:MAG: UDP-N-acetylglucosamine 1-carboxyvinyltransferase [Candidatus Kapaibacterium sp.]